MKAPSFRDLEKERYKKVKKDTSLFSGKAQQKGRYNRIEREFCLADEYSHENLYQRIRDTAIAYFLIRGIPWHDGLKGGHLPSNHLCCSQSCCVNFLFPLVKRPDLIRSIFNRWYPDIDEVLPIVEDKPLANGTFPFIAFEWTGKPGEDYLKEGERKGRAPTRGANFTSADFILRFCQKNIGIHIVLGEWKYTEEYGRSYKGAGQKGVTRKMTYAEFFKKSDGVFSANTDIEGLYEALFHEPFYQLMRLQLLAQEMQDKHEMDADRVSVLVICPEANQALRDNVTSAYLKSRFLGKDVLSIWSELVQPDRYRSIFVEDLRHAIASTPAANREWVDYLTYRYGWA